MIEEEIDYSDAVYLERHTFPLKAWKHEADLECAIVIRRGDLVETHDRDGFFELFTFVA